MIDDKNEPSLQDVLSDPMVRTVMERDEVDAADVRTLLAGMRSARERKPPGEAKSAAAHEWIESLSERGRWMCLRYSARNLVDPR